MRPVEPDPRLVRLFERHYTEILAYCVRRIGREEAEDAAAEVFATAWRRIDEIRWETVRPWLYGTARGVLSNRWRSLRKRSRLSKKVAGLAPNPPDTPEVYIVRRDADQEVVRALRTLKDSDQEILMLTAWDELTNSEIAEVLGITRSAAEQRVHRAKKRLAGLLPDIDVQTSHRAAERRRGLSQ